MYLTVKKMAFALYPLIRIIPCNAVIADNLSVIRGLGFIDIDVDRAARSGWEHFHHEADIGVRGFGAGVEEAFEQAAMALTAVVTDPASVQPLQETHLQCREQDIELLLVDWLNAVIYEMVCHDRLFSRYRVTIVGGDLQAGAWGEKIDVARHEPAVEPKGATYTELKVGLREDGRWLAQCVVDV